MRHLRERFSYTYVDSNETFGREKERESLKRLRIYKRESLSRVC